MTQSTGQDHTKPASVADTLRAARKLIETPDHWTQGAYARNAAGKMVLPDGRAARKWCMLGALAAVDGPFWSGAQDVLWQGVRRPVHEFNDSHTHAEVLAVFDWAIALAEQQS